MTLAGSPWASLPFTSYSALVGSSELRKAAFYLRKPLYSLGGVCDIKSKT